ncbi:MAG: ABC transporter ATP-binding protein [Planctomycetes bacterium]|nr:ABC transporter ATP-binding protein [Planctomycetota bacterium]
MVGLRGEDLVYAYGDGIRGVDGVSVAVSPGELLCVLGPNASGKTTLVRLLAGLLQPQGGCVWMGKDQVSSLSVRERARRVAVVPQSFLRLPALRVHDFVMGGRYAYLRRMRMATEDDVAAVRRALAHADVSDLGDRVLQELSGGQLQRVLVARAMAQEAPTLLIDEPTSSLDPEHQIAVFVLLRRLVEEEARSAVVVTHDLNLAGQFATSIALMRDGKIATVGTPGEILVPEVLEPVYGSHFRFGTWPGTGGDAERPFVVPWAE